MQAEGHSGPRRVAVKRQLVNNSLFAPAGKNSHASDAQTGCFRENLFLCVARVTNWAVGIPLLRALAPSHPI